MRQLAKKYDSLRKVFFATMAERLSRIELTRSTSLDQEMLRELRTNTEDTITLKIQRTPNREK